MEAVVSIIHKYIFFATRATFKTWEYPSPVLASWQHRPTGVRRSLDRFLISMYNFISLNVCLRWLEIVFIFPRLVLQILFQIQFGLSYQCEISHSKKWNIIESFHYIFFQKTYYHGNYIMHSVAPPKSKAVVLLREQVGEIFSNSYITCY